MGKHWHIGLMTGITITLLAAQGFASTVKKSNSGLCHSPNSPYYERIKTFTEYQDLQGCIDSGGRLRKGVQATSEKASSQKGYSRSKFGHGWDDTDGDCQNSRMEALINQSTVSVAFASKAGCRVVRGRWISPYSGKPITKASSIDIDHVVPLKYAWDHGADMWAENLREKFANDPRNLLSVEASLNRSKGALGPTEWLPPAGQCQYIARFERIIKIYHLIYQEDERRRMTMLVDQCHRTK